MKTLVLWACSVERLRVVPSVRRNLNYIKWYQRQGVQKYPHDVLIPFPLGSVLAAASSFYVTSPAVIRAHADDLEAYDTSKGTIRFSPERPLPSFLVRKLTNARIAEIQKPKD